MSRSWLARAPSVGWRCCDMGPPWKPTAAQCGPDGARVPSAAVGGGVGREPSVRQAEWAGATAPVVEPRRTVRAGAGIVAATGARGRALRRALGAWLTPLISGIAAVSVVWVTLMSVVGERVKSLAQSTGEGVGKVVEEAFEDEAPGAGGPRDGGPGAAAVGDGASGDGGAGEGVVGDGGVGDGGAFDGGIGDGQSGADGADDGGFGDGAVAGDELSGSGASDMPARAGGAVPLHPRSPEVLEEWAKEAEVDAAAARTGRSRVPGDGGRNGEGRSGFGPTPAEAEAVAALIGSSRTPVQQGAVVRRARSPQAGAPSSSGSMGAVADLALLVEGAREVAGTDWHDLPGRTAHEALDELEQLERTCAAMRAELVATIEADGLWCLDGQRTFAAWLRTRTETTHAAAARQARTGRALRDQLPKARAALAAGEIGAEHIGVLVREVLRTDRLKAQLADSEHGEDFLVAKAQEMDAGTYAKLVRAWAIAADPEAADRAWREADGKEELTLAHTLGGYHVAGWLNEVSGQAVATALKAQMGRKAKNDERTAAQRRAAALVALANRADRKSTRLNS